LAEADLQVRLEAIFAKYDSNGDGKLSRFELSELSRDVNRAMFGPGPGDPDDFLNPVKSDAFRMSDLLLRSYDLNGDGALDLSEFKAFAAGIRKK